MKNSKLSKTRIATIVLAILLVSSTYAVFNVNAQTFADPTAIVASNATLSQKINPLNGQPYGDPLQYEWPSYGADGGNTRYGAGPAPNSANILWTSNETLYSSGFGNSACTEFNGLAYGYVTSGSASSLAAFNLTDGKKVWGPITTPSTVPSGLGMFGTAAPVKVNDQVLASLSSGSIYFVNCSNGVLLQTTSMSAIGGPYGFSSIGGVSVAYWQVMYDPATCTVFSCASETGSNIAIAEALDISDPIIGARVKWTFHADTGLEALCVADGKAFVGGFGEGIIYALDLQTGQELWRAFKPGNAGYSATYYNGVLYHAASSTEIDAFDGATGALVASFNVAGGRAFYAYGGAAAYGRYFGDSIEVPQGWVSAWDAKTLQQQWKQPATYYISYMVGCVADGKFFISASDQATGTIPGGLGSFNGYHFTAFDAFTGQKIWEAPYYFRMPSVAYGHLFGTDTYGSGVRIICFGDLPGVSNLPQSQGWPMFHGPTDVNGTATGTVSGNYPIKITSATWKFQADGPASGSPVVGDGKVYFGTWSGTIYCVDASKGTKIWSNTYSTRILSTPAIVNGILYTGADDGNVYALNGSTGAQIWKEYAGGRSDAPTLQIAWQVKSSPLVWNGIVYCLASDGNLYAYNATDGTKQWVNAASTYQNGGGDSMTIHKDTLNRTCIYVNAGGTTLKKIDINGTTVSSTTLSNAVARANVGTPTIVGDLMFITFGQAASNFYSTTHNEKIAMYNATYMNSICTFTLNAGGSATTPMTQTPTYVDSCLVQFNNGTYMTVSSSGANTTSGINMFKLNATAFYTVPAVFVAEATEASCIALIPNGYNLNGSSTTGTKYQWIVNTTQPYLMLRAWHAWAGHQVFASASCAVLTGQYAGTVVDYIGNAAYGFTAYNGTSGAVLSTFTALAQVFASAALANNNVYITANDGYLYCFYGSSQGTTSIFANSNKGTQMAKDEATVIEGQVKGYQFFQSTFDKNNNATFTPVLPYQPVHLVWINQDGTSQEIVTTTDVQGNFNFTFTPTQAGNAQWLCYFPGATLSDGVSLAQAYTTYSKMNVIGVQSSPTQTESPTQSPGPVFAPEYIYAIIGIIVALIVIVAVVMLLRKRKK